MSRISRLANEMYDNDDSRQPRRSPKAPEKIPRPSRKDMISLVQRYIREKPDKVNFDRDPKDDPEYGPQYNVFYTSAAGSGNFMGVVWNKAANRWEY